jgi:hypothetical protein
MQKSVTITSGAELRFNIGAKFLSLRDGRNIDFRLFDPISQTLVGRVQHGLKGIGEPSIHLKLNSLQYPNAGNAKNYKQQNGCRPEP